MRSRWGFVAVSVAAALAVAAPARSFETDQFLALTAEIEDSAPVLNEFLNAELAALLAQEKTADLPCTGVTSRYFRRLFQGLHASRFQRFLKSEPAVDLFPDDLGYWEHLRRSIYRDPAFPFVLPLSPTIRVGEVRFGLDKFGHLFGFGRRYYQRYLELRRRGLTEEEALRKVVVRGIRQERFFLGGIADGVFSYADLEANYQGLVMARSFCEADPEVETEPLLTRVDGGWRAARDLDLRRFVTPSFDESFNTNHYTWMRRSNVRRILTVEHCGPWASEVVQERFTRYRRLDRPSLARDVVAEYFARRNSAMQQEQAMETICGGGGEKTTVPSAR